MPALDAPGGSLASDAGEGGTGKHGVFGGYPAPALTAKPGRDAFLDGGGADDFGLSHFNQGGTLGEGLEAGGYAGLADFV